MGLAEQVLALFVDDLAPLGEGVIDRALGVAVLIGANELHAADLAVEFTADVAGGAELAILGDRLGLDRVTLVVQRFGGRWPGAVRIRRR